MEITEKYIKLKFSSLAFKNVIVIILVTVLGEVCSHIELKTHRQNGKRKFPIPMLAIHIELMVSS